MIWEDNRVLAKEVYWHAWEEVFRGQTLIRCSSEVAIGHSGMKNAKELLEK